MENTASKYSHFQAPPNHSKPVFISTFQVFYKQKKKGNSFAFSSIYCFFLSSSNPRVTEELQIESSSEAGCDGILAARWQSPNGAKLAHMIVITVPK